MKKLLIIGLLISILFLQGCFAKPSFLGFDGPPSDEEIQQAHWRGWINSLPEDSDKLIESINAMKLIYNEKYTVEEPGEFFFQTGNLFISQQVFLKLFDTTGQLNLEKYFVIKDDKVFYEGVEIELLESGKVAKVEI